MDPITIAALGTMAVSTIAQIYQSEQARGANQKQLDNLKALYNSLTPPNYDKSIDTPPEQIKADMALPQYADALQSPQYQQTKLTPNVLSQVGQLSPDFARYVQENAPTTITKTADMQGGRAAQMQALDRYKQIGEGEFDPQYQAMVTKANQDSQANAHSASQSVLQDAARRGVQNSGLAIANQQSQGAQSMNQLGNANLQAAAQAYQNRLGALASGANLGGQIQQQDTNLQGQNAAIINAFNQRMQSGLQSTENNRSNLANAAQAHNLGEAQRISDSNAQTQNSYDQADRSRNDQIANSTYQNQLGQQNRSDQIGQANYNAKMQALQYNNNLASQLAQWNADQRTKKNNLMTQDYQNQVQKIGGQATTAGQQIGMNTQNAQDRNNQLQGIANIGGIAAQGQMAQNWQNNYNTNQANMAQYSRTGRFMTPAEKDQFNQDGTLPQAPSQGGHDTESYP